MPPLPHGQIIGCRVEISLDPTWEKTGSMNFVGEILLYFDIGTVSGSGSRFSLSLLWNLEPAGKGKGITPKKIPLTGIS
jgi:hypothetical protein